MSLVLIHGRTNIRGNLLFEVEDVDTVIFIEVAQGRSIFSERNNVAEAIGIMIQKVYNMAGLLSVSYDVTRRISFFLQEEDESLFYSCHGKSHKILILYSTNDLMERSIYWGNSNNEIFEITM